jgi:hypothetical protein
MRKYLPALAVLMLSTAAVEAAAQSAPPQAKSKAVDIDLSAGLVPKSPARKDIPAIAKASNGAIVTIVMAAGEKPIARGTGFVVSADGVIVTNYHVIKEGNVALVKFPDGRILPVDGVLATDKVRDLAVIKMHDPNDPYAEHGGHYIKGDFKMLTLGNSDRIQVGEEVVAIGNPLGLELTVSNGILSGVRTIEEEGGKFLQTTAPISPGSSGGPLFNMRGEVIGITSMGFKGGGNLNFAIPVNDAKRLLLNQSAKLQNLPNEAEKAEPKKANAVVRYHVMAYNPNARALVVRYNNKLFTLTVTSSKECVPKSIEEFMEPYSDKDCKNIRSMAGDLIGQDILDVHDHSADEPGSKFKGYRIFENSPGVDYCFGSPAMPNAIYHFEIWKVVQIEEVNP